MDSAHIRSAVSKVKVGKKIERGFSRQQERHQTVSSPEEATSSKTLEKYVCHGNFLTDFNEMCHRANMSYIPPIIPRPRPIGYLQQEVGPSSRGGREKGRLPQPEPEPVVELTENGEPVEAPPKTYTTKEKLEYFRPSIQVEMDHPDRGDTVTEVFIRGWKIDTQMADIFKDCWPAIDKLQSINLWNAGLTGEVVHKMAAFLPCCLNLRTLVLDGNAVSEENWHELISDTADKKPNLIQNLSLRHCGITDKGATLIARCLGDMKSSNTKLQTLHLSNNGITDIGLGDIAKGLRMNRTLLSLTLAHNQIEDKGAIKLAEVLSKFQLTHEEIVERRRLKAEISNDTSQSRTFRRESSKERPGSTTRKDRSSKKKEGKTGKEERDERHDKTKGKEKGGGRRVSVASSSGRSPLGSVNVDTGKAPSRGPAGGRRSSDKPTPTESKVSDTTDVVHPLLEDKMEGFPSDQIWIPGNRVIISINLARNQIREAGMEALLTAVECQTELLRTCNNAGNDVTMTTDQQTPRKDDNRTSGTGLLRLVVTKNKVPADSEVIKKLTDVMTKRDPFYKSPPQTPDV